MLKRPQLFFGVILLCLAVLLPACSPAGNQTGTTVPATGTVVSPTGQLPALTSTIEFKVTDAPPDADVTSIMLTVDKIEIHRSGGLGEVPSSSTTPTETLTQTDETNSDTTNSTTDTTSTTTSTTTNTMTSDISTDTTTTDTSDGGPWLTITPPADANTFDLLQIQGIEQSLASSEMPVGQYSGIRITVSQALVGLGGDTPKTATIPSGVLRINQPFNINDGEATVMLLDFDAARMVNITGNGKIEVKPVVKLTSRQQVKNSQTNNGDEAQQDPGYDTALNFLKNSPTFVFDGIADSIKPINGVVENGISTFTIDFDCAHGGYGDRTGQNLTQSVTPHTAVIKVQGNEVIYAVIDNQWDMMAGVAISVYTDETVPVTAAIGQLFVISLKSNPSTGYSWTAATDNSLLELVDTEYQAGSTTPLPGSGGNQYFTFKPLSAGTTEITFQYQRPWENQPVQEKVFNITIN